ncbi:hypothetical protein BaRGS_00030945 [Batillaria attramentaria]|uniref:Uncharacterized protein n=1 Tax=Batillaria attramentaria TaxID=370345 RepID=A0ABD0JSC9_9CAEN
MDYMVTCDDVGQNEQPMDYMVTCDDVGQNEQPMDYMVTCDDVGQNEQPMDYMVSWMELILCQPNIVISMSGYPSLHSQPKVKQEFNVQQVVWEKLVRWRGQAQVFR